MIKDDIIAIANKFTKDCQSDYIFDAPIFAFGSADDELYEQYKSTDIIGGHFLTPLEWLPSAKTVISFFLPYADSIKKSNSHDCTWPSEEWLHGRYEGQLFINELLKHIRKQLLGSGYSCLVPAFDSRFGYGDSEDKFASNWSERHAAFACGLGTFGLSKGIITEKGTCGRLGSILTALDLPKDTRQYNDIYEYCSMCGLCIPRCPVKAISFEEGKEHAPCSEFLKRVGEIHKPRYGCGKCQINVPCESRRAK